jgi:tetratricopeptide (TPR) repeat protein
MRFGVYVAAAAVLWASSAKPAAAQGRQFAQPTCDVNKGHYLINSAVLYLVNAGRTRFQDQRERDLRDARRVLLEAIEEKGQDQNGSAWYFLGRYYQEKRDLPGADSAFTRAEALLPDCRDDINENRRRLWVPILNGSVDKIKAGDNAGAMSDLRLANSIYRVEPPAFYYMGQIFANQQQRDSAVKYFSHALELARMPANAEKPQYNDIRNDAAFNIARLYHQDQQYDSAIVWYQRFRTDQPNDPQALTGLAAALESAGRGADAVGMYDSVLLLADSMPTLDLFQAGVAMFRVKRYDRAAEAFDRGLARSPYYRDGLFNLANTYLSLANDVDSTTPKTQQEEIKRTYGEKMRPIVERLVAVDPNSTAALRLLAAAFQLVGDSDSTLAVLQRIEDMPFEITVSTFVPVGSGFDVRGIVTNLRSEAAEIPAVTFEFITEDGTVVQSKTIEPQTIDGGGVAPFALAPIGEGIAAWRYHVGTS